MKKLYLLFKWYFRIRKYRTKGNYPIQKRHIWPVSKFMAGL